MTGKLHSVWWRGRQWVVTAYGIECLPKQGPGYVIKAKELRASEPEWSWPQQLAEKEWVDIEDFIAAWLIALAMHGKTQQGGAKTIRQIIEDARDLAADTAAGVAARAASGHSLMKFSDIV